PGDEAEEFWEWLGARDPSLRLDEIGATGQIDQVRVQSRWAAQEVRHLVELIEDVARLAATERPLEGLVVPVEHVVVPGIGGDESCRPKSSSRKMPPFAFRWMGAS